MAKLSGASGFESYYSLLYGQRWPALRQACALEQGHYELRAGLEKSYWLDEASVLAGRCVEARPGMRVLDLCAAPGGKTLVLAQELFGLIDAQGQPLTATKPGTDTVLIANERSATRRERLWRVIREHLPPPVHDAIQVYGHDASRWGQFEPACYDAILLDAPCSSERHLIQNPSHLTDWSPGRVSRLAQQGYAMLLSAIQALKPGGHVVFATCALAQAENDGVIERVLDRLAKKSLDYGYDAELFLPHTPTLRPDWSEPTPCGMQVWPDHALGRGPLFISRIRKSS